MPYPSVKILGFHYSPSPSLIRGKCPTTHLDAKTHEPLSRPTPVSKPFLHTSPLLLRHSTILRGPGPRSLPCPHPAKLCPKAVIKSSFDQLPNSELNMDLFSTKLKNQAQVTYENQRNCNMN